MKSTPGRFLVPVLTILLVPVILGAGARDQAASVTPRPERIAIVHAAVIPMDRERVLRDQTVLVADGTIVQMGPTATTRVPGDALVVDATGRYVLPAFCDMHVHLLGEAWNMMLPPQAQLASKDVPWESFLLPYVANGVTTVQVLFATPEHLPLRGAIDRGEILGPRLILARMIDGPGKAWPPPLGVWVASAEEARQAVRRAKEEGYDKIKVYSFLDKASYDAIVMTARDVGLDVIGHIPMSLSLEYVLDAGQKLVAHSEEVAKHAGNDPRRERIDALADAFVKRGAWLMPTLVTTESILEIFDDPDALLSRPEVAYYRHPMQQGVWSFVLEKLYRPIPSAGRKELREAFEQVQRPLTLSLSRKGGRLLAGSDTVLPGLVSGFALHRELVQLVDAGVRPFDALRAATVGPFEYLGERDRSGTVEAGTRSDLVLLDANPLEDVSASSRVSGVLIRGRWLTAEALQKRMKALAASAPRATGPPGGLRVVARQRRPDRGPGVR